MEGKGEVWGVPLAWTAILCSSCRDSFRGIKLMLFDRVSAIRLCTLVLGFAATSSSAQDVENGKCFEVVEAMNYVLQGMPKVGTTGISFFDRGETRFMLFVALEEQKDGSEPNDAADWRLLERQGESLVYCLSGAGRSLEFLSSLDAIPGFKAEFGLPGSGKRRCNDESDGPLGSVSVRSWANKELGPSLVQHLGSPFKGTSFTVLFASDSVQGKFPWIILQDRGTQSCYFARGEDTSFTADFSIKAELVQDPTTLEPLE